MHKVSISDYAITFVTIYIIVTTNHYYHYYPYTNRKCPFFVDTMAQFSKDELSFAEEIPKHVEIECPVCLNILTDPHLVTCCGNNFCGSCIERVKAGDGACPMCKEKNYQSFVDKKCLRIINGLQVYCLNQKKGCHWKGELKHLSTHTNRGKREGECLYEEVKCRYEECGSKGQRQHIGYHEQQRCPQRPFKCTYCSTKGTHCFITEEHVKNCSKVPTACPNKCTNALMPKDSVPAHLIMCPLQPVDCVFSWAGCKERPLRKDIELHTTDTKHMMLLAVACGELKKENEALKKTCNQLKKEDEALKKTCDQLESESTYTRDLLVAVAADTHPILPITVTREREVVHFYTEVGGYHMSAVFMSHTIYLALHRGKFDRIMKLTDYPKINIKVIDERNNDDTPCTSFQGTITLKIPDDALVSFLTSKNLVTPAGIISYQVSIFCVINYPFEISFKACNELTVLLFYHYCL